MAAVLFKARNRGQAATGERGKLGGGEESEFARRLARIQQQSDIRGRNACGFVKTVFFDVIGNKVVVALPAELTKIAPNTQSMFQQAAN